MSLGLRGLALTAVMLVSSVAPSAAACLRDAGTREMGCCAREGHCDEPALQRACCPCSPSTPATAPDSGASVTGPASPAPAVLATASDPFGRHGRLALVAEAASRAARLCASHDPPWLLHASLLI